MTRTAVGAHRTNPMHQVLFFCLCSLAQSFVYTEYRVKTIPEHRHYRWPAKLKKFGIDDPFLKILVCKYENENEIPWQLEVRDATSLGVCRTFRLDTTFTPQT